MKKTGKSETTALNSRTIIISTIIGILLLIFTLSGVKAAEFSIFESVRNFLGFQAPAAEKPAVKVADETSSKFIARLFSPAVENSVNSLFFAANLPISQNFDGIGTTATAALPTDFKADKNNSAVRTVGTYAAAGTATERVKGANVASNASGGIYNFGAGATDTGSDRALGFLSTGSDTQSGNLYVQINNNTGNALSGLQISYDVEKYRNGSNSAGYRIQMYYSTDGSAWTSAGGNFLTSFAADADNSGFATAPGATVSVANQTLNQAIASGNDIYLAWNYSVTTGTTTTNAQALAIDNINITGIGAPPSLGNYADASVNLSADTTVATDAPPVGASYATATTTADFKGKLEIDPATGDVRVTNAYPAGNYAITVTAYGAGGETTKSFALTVTTPAGCDAFHSTSFAPAANYALPNSAFPLSAAVGDFNGDGKQDIAVADNSTNNVSVLLRNATNDGFDAAVNYAVTTPYSVAVGDFNGDGKLDIAANSYNNNAVSVLYRNAANNGFDAAANFTVGTNPIAIAVGDFNGDGKLDIVAANTSSSNVSVLYRNAANTGFDSAANFASPGSPSSVAVGDFNGDGKPDIVAVNNSSAFVNVLLRNAANTGFDAAVTYSIGSRAFAVATGDLNGDGKTDIVAPNYDNANVSVLLRNAANNGFDAAANYAVGTNPHGIAVGDFNNDGKQDIAAANLNGNTVSVLLRNATNDGFNTKIDFTVAAGPRAAAIGDFNGDNRQDIVTANSNGDNISVLQRVCNNAPNFTSVTNQTRAQGTTANAQIAAVTDPETGAASVTVTASTVPSGITVSNIVNTGGTITADVGAGGATAPGDYTVVLTASDGTLSTNANLIVTVPPTTPEIVVRGNNVIIADGDTTPSSADHTDFGSVAIGDTLERTFTIENIGAPPLTVGSVTISGGQPAAFSVTQQPASPVQLLGTTTFKVKFAPTTLGLQSTTISFSNDDPDENPFDFVILGTSVEPATIGNYPNTVIALSGNAIITPNVAPANATLVTATTTADFNGEIEVDPTTGVIRVTNAHPAGSFPVTVTSAGVANTATTTFTLTVTTPPGCGAFNVNSFASAANFAAGTLPISAAVGDFNADGKQDIAVANANGLNVSVLLRNAANTGFDPKVDYSLGSAPNAIAVADFNADGKEDIVVSESGTPGKVSVLYRNAANTGFDTVVHYSAGSNSASAVAAGDFNGDGKQDIVTANSSNISVLYRNAANNGFDAAATFPVAHNPVSVAVADFNGDGKPDIATSNSFPNNTISVLYRNAANDGFDAAVNFNMGGSPTTGAANITAGDLNGDGRPDIANTVINNVSVLYRNAANTGFDAAVNYPVPIGDLSVRIGDFNNDGRPDLITSHFVNDHVSIALRNAANTGFDAAINFTTDDGPRSAIVGDFNGDNRQDIATPNSNANSVSVLQRVCNNAPTFTSVTNQNRPQGTTSNVQIAAVTDPETGAASVVVTASTVPSGITVSNIVNTNGTITADVGAGGATAPGDYTVVLTAFDGELSTNANLIVTVPPTTQEIVVRGNNVIIADGDATPSAADHTDFGTVSIGNTFERTFTIENIGTLPLNVGSVSVSGGQANQFSVTQQPASSVAPFGTTTFKVQFAPSSTGLKSTTVTFGNDDADENPFDFAIQGTSIDAATLGNYPNTTVALSGNTTVTPTAAPTNTNYATVATSTDFKGELEVNPATGVVRVTNAHSAGTYTVTVRATNDGGTTTKTFTLTVATSPSCLVFSETSFAPAVTSAVSPQPRTPAVGDFNGDGKQDVATANYNGDNVSVLLRNAANTGFDAAINYALGAKPLALTLADFNADGKEDLATANNNNTVSVLLRNAANTGFDAPVNYTVGNAPVAVTAGDFNGDGKQDIATANSGSSGTVSVLHRNAANTGFDAPLNYAVGSNPLSVTVADFNADGKTDIAVANYTGNNVSVLYRNAANDGFDAAANFSVGSSPESIAVADLNGDGKQDMAVANSSSNSISVLYRNAANTGFDAAVNSAVSSPVTVATGDFNKDGKQDIVAVNYQISGTVSVLLRNTANTGFDAPVSFDVGTYPYGVAVGDFNADRKQDIAVSNNSSNDLSFLMRADNCPPDISPATGLSRHQGSAASNSQIAAVDDVETPAGSLTVQATTVPSGITVSNLINNNGAVTADLSADCSAATGNNTIVLTVTDASNVTTSANLIVNVLANPSPTLGNYPNTTVNFVSSGNVVAPDAAPADNGSVQSVTASASAGFTGSFSVNAATGAVTINNAAPAGTYTVTVTATDNCGATTSKQFTLIVNPPFTVTSAAPSQNALNAARTANVGATFSDNVNQSTVTASSFKIRGSGTAGYGGTISFPNAASAQLDPTNDFKAGELITAALSRNVQSAAAINLTPFVWQFRAAATPSSGRMMPHPTSPSFDAGSDSEEVALGDLDGDGDLDAVIANGGGNSTIQNQPETVWMNNGGGVFTPHPTIPSFGSDLSPSVTLGDIDGDGDLDALISNYSQNETVWKNDGTGGFTQFSSFNSSATMDIELGDLDGDGDLDAIAASDGGNQTAWANDGNGNFSPNPASPTLGASNMFDADLGDIDGDGDLDVVFAFFYGDEAVWKNDGNGGFTFHSTFGSGTSNSPAIALGDIDGDGDLDVVVANTNDQAEQIWKNDGSGNFSLHQSFDAGSDNSSFSQDIALGDIDGDGDLDILVANHVLAPEKVWLNNGSGTFAPHPTVPSFGAGHSQSIALGDIDGDGDLDALVGNEFGVNTVWLNNTAPAITPSAALTRQQGTAAGNSNIAVVTDNESAAGNLTVQATTVPSGISVTNIANANGTITADVAADCSAALGDNTVVLTVTDEGGLSTNANLTVNVTANTAPTLTYPNAAVLFGASTTVNPATASDNGNIASYSLQSQGTYTGGISVNNLTGEVSLSSAAPPGTHAITIRATDNCGATTDTSFTLTVNQAPAITSANNTALTVGAAGSFTITATGFPSPSISSTGALPSGVTFTDNGNGTASLAGTPAAGTGGAYPLTITAGNGFSPDAVQNFTLTINQAPAITSANNTAFTRGTPGSFQVTATGFPAPTFSVFSGTLPGGITLSASGLLSGTATQSGTFPLTIRAANAAGTNDQSFTLTVNEPPTLGNYADTTIGLSGNTTVTPDAAPTNATTVTATTTADFKGELEIDPATGVVRLTNAHPAGTYTVTISATGAGGTTTKTFTLTVSTPVGCTPFSSISFASAANSSTGTSPNWVAVGDFNGDGKQDLVVANTGSNHVSVLLRNAANTGFDAAVNLPVGNQPQAVAVGDLNADGKQDIAVTNGAISSNSVSVLFRNTANTGFNAAVNLPVGNNPRGVAIGDFNGDGKQDIAASNSGSGTVSVLLRNAANNGFDAAVSFAVGSSPQSAAVGDFNADGRTDIVVANLNSNNVSVLLRNATNDGFETAVNLPVGSAPLSAAVGDFNGDGRSDIAAANFNNNNVSVLLRNAANNGFDGAVNFAVGTNPASVAVGDFNNDDKQDIVAANANNASVSVLLRNAANNGFNSAVNFSVGSGPRSVAVGDFNGDGRQDIAAANQFTSNVSVLQRDCNLPPSINATTGLTRQQGTAAINSQIAVVSDPETAAGSLTVQATNVPVGITVSNIVNTNGNVTADLAADCAAATGNNTIVLTVTDADNSSTTANLTINVTANTAPTIGNYSNTTVIAGSSGTIVTPDAPPADNGSVQSVTASASAGFTGTFVGNTTTGAVTINNAAPAGTYTVTVTVTDNCGAAASRQFTLTVNNPSVSGTVSYGVTPLNQSPKLVSGVLLSAAGASSASGTTDSAGIYLIENLTSGGNYTVTPTKTGGANGITAFDATLVLRCVAAGGGCVLTTNQRKAADSDADTNVTAFDATQMLRYVAANGSNANTGQAGKWKFDPVSRPYTNLSANQTGQDYTAFLIGEVDGDWQPPSSLNESAPTEQEAAESTAALLKAENSSVVIQAPETTGFEMQSPELAEIDSMEEIIAAGEQRKKTPEIELSLPENAFAVDGGIVMIPVYLANPANKQISAYSFAVRFDPNVLQPENAGAIETANSLSDSGFIIVSDTNTKGRIGIAASAPNKYVKDSGTLLYLRFRVVGFGNDSANGVVTTVLSFETTKKGSTEAFADQFGNRILSASINNSFFVIAGKAKN